ncbi:LAFA_0F07668g1_1 [Lachancea sp. 'fantastica']|nr:LAFA_0F07668g1_1 [Lachancea sp. 'fantastica']
MSESAKSGSNSDSLVRESSAEPATGQLNATGSTGSKEMLKGVEGNIADKDVASNGMGPVTERRRSKASRACDQCREKKTKCDFGDGSHSAVCSVCKKLGKTCTFARVPMKRGPIKGYNRQSEDAEAVDGGGWGSRKRSCSESFPEDSTRGKIDLVSLPPLNQYLPSSSSSGPQQTVHGMLVGAQQQQHQQQYYQQQQQPQQQQQSQQFWKVPYHEYQYQRRESVDSLASDTSNRRGSEQYAYAASNASSASPFYPMPQPPSYGPPPNVPQLEADFQDPRTTAHLPALQRSSSIQSNTSQYPYSQFNNVLPQPSAQQPFVSILTQPQHLQNGGNQEQFREFNPAFHSRKNSDVSEAVSPSSSVKMVPTKAPVSAPNVPDGALKSDLNRKRSQSEHSSIQQASEANSDGVAQAKPKVSMGRSASSTNKRSGSQASADSHGSIGRSIVVYGKIPDNQLIDLYYEFIHPTFPVIPINKHTLANDVLVINTQPVSHIHELNCYVLQWFRNSLELLVRVALKKPSGSAYDYSDGVVDVFDSQTTFIAALNESFQRIVDIHPRLRENDGVLSQKIRFIYLATFTILNYVLAFVGYDNSFVLGMSVTIFNELKLFRCLTYNETDLVEEDDGRDPVVAPGEKGFEILFKRLYSILAIFDSLQSCAFGVPKLMSVPLPDLIDVTFAYSSDKWSLENDRSRVEIMQQSLKLGHILSRLSTGRKSTRIGPGVDWPDVETQNTADKEPSSHFMQLLIESHKLVARCTEVLPELTEQHILELCFAICQLVTTMQRVLTAVMKTNPTNSIDSNNRPPSNTQQPGVYANQRHDDAAPSTTESDMYKKLLGLNGNANTSLSQGTVSPFVVAIVAYVSNLLELVKQLPSTLIALVVQRLTLQSDSQRVVLALSNCMSELVQITSLLSVLKPYKMFEQTPRAHRASSLALARKLRDRYSEKSNNLVNADIETRSLSDTIWGLLSSLELGWL